MRLTQANVNRVAPLVYTSLALLAALTFLAATLPGDYDSTARIGGAIWVFLLAMVILMPTVPAILHARATGQKIRLEPHDHDAMMRAERTTTMAKDPVCGMDVDPATAAASSEYMGQTHYFCALSCQEAFNAAPEKYLPANAK
ncbi:MAG: YHS domain-containing protein [Dehalococcoidia bacterium]